MIYFTGDLLSKNTISEIVKIDSKGRISIPAYLRRNFGLEMGDEMKILFDLKKSLFVVVFESRVFFGPEISGQKGISGIKTDGQGGVKNSMGVCGAPGLGAKVGPFSGYVKCGLSGIPGSGPKFMRGDENEW